MTCMPWEIVYVMFHFVQPFILLHRFLAYRSMVQSGNKNKSVFVSSYKALSFLRWYYDSAFGIFPHLTAIIDVKDGVSVIIIVWHIVNFY